MLKQEGKEHQKIVREKGQAKIKTRIKVRRKLDQRGRKEEGIILKNQRKRREVEKTLKNQKADVQGKGRIVSRRSQRKVKIRILNKGKRRGNKAKGNQNPVNLTK